MEAMPQKIEPMPIMFRTFADGCVMALLLQEAFNWEPWLCDAFVYVGGHTSANPQAVVQVTRPATSEEIEELWYLMCRDYDYKPESLVIRHRQTHFDRHVRQTKIDKLYPELKAIRGEAQ